MLWWQFNASLTWQTRSPGHLLVALTVSESKRNIARNSADTV